MRASSIAFSSSYPLLIRTLDVLLTCTSIRPADINSKPRPQPSLLSLRVISPAFRASRAPLPLSPVLNHDRAPAELALGGHPHATHLKLRHIANNPSLSALVTPLPASLAQLVSTPHRNRSFARYTASSRIPHPSSSPSQHVLRACLFSSRRRLPLSPSRLQGSKLLTLVRVPLSARPIDIMQGGRPSIQRSTLYMRLRAPSFERQVQRTRSSYEWWRTAWQQAQRMISTTPNANRIACLPYRRERTRCAQQRSRTPWRTPSTPYYSFPLCAPLPPVASPPLPPDPLPPPELSLVKIPHAPTCYPRILSTRHNSPAFWRNTHMHLHTFNSNALVPSNYPLHDVVPRHVSCCPTTENVDIRLGVQILD